MTPAAVSPAMTPAEPEFCDATRRGGVARFRLAGSCGAGSCGAGRHRHRPNDRAISISCTSVVPSPISRILLSR